MRKINEYRDQNGNHVEEWLLEHEGDKNYFEREYGMKIRGNTFKQIHNDSSLRTVFNANAKEVGMM